MLHKNGARGREGKTSPVHTQSAASARHGPQEAETRTATPLQALGAPRADVERWGAGGSFPAQLVPPRWPPGLPRVFRGPTTQATPSDAPQGKRPRAGGLPEAFPLLGGGGPCGSGSRGLGLPNPVSLCGVTLGKSFSIPLGDSLLPFLKN